MFKACISKYVNNLFTSEPCGLESAVPQPRQYKNVFKLIATVMYMIAVIYFLIQIAMELYQKKFIQAIIMLFMFLIGTAILYIAYKSVFNVS